MWLARKLVRKLTSSLILGNSYIIVYQHLDKLNQYRGVYSYSVPLAINSATPPQVRCLFVTHLLSPEDNWLTVTPGICIQ